MKKTFLLIALFLTANTLFSQDEINVLFLGNSYTFVNDLPNMIEEIAENENKIFNHKSVTPGGCTLFQHVDSQTSMSEIRKGNWDYVILQEQSQLPSIDYYRHNAMKPAYKTLYDSIMFYNPTAKVIGYMTWGRRNGGKQCVNFGEGIYCSADFADFNHMQDSLTAAYCENAYATNSYVAPVGEAWRTALTTDPTLVLHSSDDSHPSYDGSYLAACVFYSIFWDKSPIGIYHKEQINDEKAKLLQTIANDVFFNNLEKWNIKTTENIQENKHSMNFEIENNPNSDSFIIRNINNITSTIKVFNTNGMLVAERKSNNDETININNSFGLYIVQIIDCDNNIYTKKVVKN